MSTGDASLLAAAVRYAALGWPVLALHTPDHEGACSCGRAGCSKPGKHPRTRHGLRDASADEAQIHAWWVTWPNANVGLITGGLVVVDIDGTQGRQALAALQRAHRPLPPTLTALTGRGMHLYFQAGEHRIGNSAGRLGAGLDVRGRGGHVVAPPACTPTATDTAGGPGIAPHRCPPGSRNCSPPPRRHGAAPRRPAPHPAIARSATSPPPCSARSLMSPPRGPARATTRSTAPPSASASSPAPATAASTGSPARC
jgi:hypothetical protein